MFTHHDDWLAPASTQHPEPLAQPPAEVAEDDQADALRVPGHPFGVADLPLDPRVADPSGRDLGGEHVVGRPAAAVRGVDQDRVVAAAVGGPDHLELGAPPVVGVEPDDAGGRCDPRRGAPDALPAVGSRRLAAVDDDVESGGSRHAHVLR